MLGSELWGCTLSLSVLVSLPGTLSLRSGHPKHRPAVPLGASGEAFLHGLPGD